MSNHAVAVTRARVDIAFQNNVTWTDGFQFGTVGDTSWNFTDMQFQADIKASKEDPDALLVCTRDNGRIHVDSEVDRVLHFLVPHSVIQANLPPGDYVYDLIMFDVDDVSTVLMGGTIKVKQGVTQELS